MATIQGISGRGTAIQGKFFTGKPNFPVLSPPHTAIQPQVVKPRLGQPISPRSIQTSCVNVNNMPVQRAGNGESFRLPANLSNFGSGAGQPLPESVLQKMESFFNTSLADVRIHVGPQASSIGALAFTHGSNLYFAPGQYNPGTTQGQQLLGHELTHVVQQRAGRVRNPFGGGVAVVHDIGMEAEADRNGIRASSHIVTIQKKRIGTQLSVPAKSILKTVQRHKDRIPKIKALMGKNPIGSISRKAQVATVCHKVKKWAELNNFDFRTVGRDIKVYNGVLTSATSVSTMLKNWNPDTKSDADTAGMLMDYALIWKNGIVTETLEDGSTQILYVRDRNGEIKKDKKTGRDATLPQLQYEAMKLTLGTKKTAGIWGTQDGAARGDGHSFVPNSDLAKLAKDQKWSTQSGPSASTSVLLWMLRTVSTFTPITQDESFAVVSALSDYWQKFLKKIRGQYHTKFEAMIPLARHQGKFVDDDEAKGTIRETCHMRHEFNVKNVIATLTQGQIVTVQWQYEKRFNLGVFSKSEDHVLVTDENNHTGWVKSSAVAYVA